MTRLVLASTSPTRRMLLANAGFVFDALAPLIDEREVEAPLLAAGHRPADIALSLAKAKAESVSALMPERMVIGADQILEFQGERLTKADSIAQACRQLLALAGHPHALHSALCIASNGRTIWSHIETAVLTMRSLSPEEIDSYLSRIGSDALTSVGAYQLEGIGINLFERVEGDHFAVLGFPLLPLLAFLRTIGINCWNQSSSPTGKE